MRWACLIIGIMVSLFNKGIAGEYPTTECRMDVKFEMVSITPEGITISTDNFGEVGLENLHFDEKGFYSLWQVSYVCADCKKELQRHDSECDCGSDEVALIRVDQKDGKEYLIRLFSKVTEVAQKFEGRNNFDKISQMGTDMMGAMIHWKVNGDDNGNKSAEVDISEEIESRNGNVSGNVYAGARFNQDRNGNTTVQYEVGGTIDFDY